MRLTLLCCFFCSISLAQVKVPVNIILEVSGTGSWQSLKPAKTPYFNSKPAPGFAIQTGAIARVYKGVGIGVLYNFHSSKVKSTSISFSGSQSSTGTDLLHYHQLGMQVGYKIKIKSFFIEPNISVYASWLIPIVDFAVTPVIGRTYEMDTITCQNILISEDGYGGYKEYNSVGVTLAYQLNIGYQLKYIQPYIKFSLGQGLVLYHTNYMFRKDYANGVLVNDVTATFYNKGTAFFIGARFEIILGEIVNVKRNK